MATRRETTQLSGANEAPTGIMDASAIHVEVAMPRPATGGSLSRGVAEGRDLYQAAT